MALCNISENIRSMRKSRGLTMAQVADRMTDAGEDVISSSMVGSWERGERRPSADSLYLLSIALRCSIDSLFYGEQKRAQNRLIEEIQALSEREKETLLFTASIWDGDEHALLEWVRMYVSIPHRYRTDVAGLAISQFKHLVKDRVFSPALDVRIKLLQDQCYKIDR